MYVHTHACMYTRMYNVACTHARMRTLHTTYDALTLVMPMGKKEEKNFNVNKKSFNVDISI